MSDDTTRPSLGFLVGKLEGLADIMTTNFNSLQQQLDRRFTDVNKALGRFEELPTTIAHLETRLDDTIKRVEDVESQIIRQNEWKRGPLFVVSVGVVIAVINLLPLLVK